MHQLKTPAEFFKKKFPANKWKDNDWYRWMFCIACT